MFNIMWYAIWMVLIHLCPIVSQKRRDLYKMNHQKLSYSLEPIQQACLQLYARRRSNSVAITSEDFMVLAFAQLEHSLARLRVVSIIWRLGSLFAYRLRYTAFQCKSMLTMGSCTTSFKSSTRLSSSNHPCMISTTARHCGALFVCNVFQGLFGKHSIDNILFTIHTMYVSLFAIVIVSLKSFILLGAVKDEWNYRRLMPIVQYSNRRMERYKTITHLQRPLFLW